MPSLGILLLIEILSALAIHPIQVIIATLLLAVESILIAVPLVLPTAEISLIPILIQTVVIILTINSDVVLIELPV
jgi:hypothetical protein